MIRRPTLVARVLAAATNTLDSLGADGWEQSVIQGPFAVLRRAR